MSNTREQAKEILSHQESRMYENHNDKDFGNCDLLHITQESIINAMLDFHVQQSKERGSELIGFGVWLNANVTPCSAKDGWWIFKDIWLTTDECLERYRTTLTK